LFFAKQEANLIFESWTNQIGERSTVMWPESDWTKFILSQNLDIAKYIEIEEKKSIGVVELKKREKFLIKKIKNIKLDLVACENGKAIEEKLLSNELDLRQMEIIICGQRFSFLGLKNEWEKKDHIFKKIKKLKRGKQLLAERLIEAEAELAKVENGELKRSTTKEKAIQVLWKKVEKNTKYTSSINQGDFIHIEIGGINGLIGLNSSGNDTIRGLSHKEHLWFHIENYPGAHCILKTENISLLSMEQIEMIGSILRDYSKLEIMEIPLLFTQVKNIKGVKGAKGKVIVSKAKHLRCLYKNWKEIISIV
jgi:predicted ribosome quality control (RQC) complex YloA/Tae2 family protein